MRCNKQTRMGLSGSREVVVPLAVNPLSLPPTDANRRQAEEAYHAAEDSIFQEGYRQGCRDTAARFNEAGELAARAAYSRLLVLEEERKLEEVEAAAKELRKSQYRSEEFFCNCVSLFLYPLTHHKNPSTQPPQSPPKTLRVCCRRECRACLWYKM